MARKILCEHCGEKIINEVSWKDEGVLKRFCCHGCLGVYRLLKSTGLEEFYKLKNTADQSVAPRYLEDKFIYLDDDEFKHKYVNEEEQYNEFKFFIEGVHCVACLWILEKLSTLEDGVISSKLNMSNAILKIRYDKDKKLSQITRKIAMLGYVPHPILTELDEQKFAQAEDRKMLIKIGVAFACAGNIMLYSLAVYAGAQGEFKSYFNIFSFLCSLPVVLYSAIPFYKNAFVAIQSRTSSIDIPIVLAFVIGMGLGIYSFIFSKDYFYFDTLATLVFLLLFSRFTLRKAQQKGLAKGSLSQFFAIQYATKIQENEATEVLTRFLKPGDIIRINPLSIIPIDAKITKGTTHINNSLLTGEIRPERATVGDAIYMGAKNLDKQVDAVVSSSVDETRLGKILKEVESGWGRDSFLSLITDKIAKRFMLIIFALSFFFLAYFSYTLGVEEAFSRTLSLLIITCPCALALTTPLAFILGLSNLAKAGVVIKDENVIEKLTKVKNIFLDKTGTLTKGEFFVEKIVELEKGYLSYLYEMEKHSRHPIALSILKFLNTKDFQLKKINFDQVIEIPGKGVEAKIKEDLYEIQRSESEIEQTCVGLYKNNKALIKIYLSDELRQGVSKALNSFKKLNIKSHLLTGDTDYHAQIIAKKLNIPRQRVFSEKSPEQKKEIILGHKNAMMAGDGVNDALALKNSFVGIAVSGSVEVSLRAADVYLSRSGVSHIAGILKASHFIMSVIYKNLIFSAVYNIIGVYLAFNGMVSPLMAAVLMPLSSFTVIFSTFISTSRLKKLIQ